LDQEQNMQVNDVRDRNVRDPEVIEHSHLKKFHAARQRLVEQRCALIKALAISNQAELAEAHIDMVVRVQRAIEVIDQAIDDEQPVPQQG
jgi:hypothetical protein